MESEQAATAASTTRLSPFKYSNRVLLKTILDRRDGGLELIGERVVIGGWVKSSKEVRKEPVPHIAGDYVSGEPEPRSDVCCCIEILQSRIPFLRTIVKVLGGGSGGHYPLTDKLETSIHTSPPPSTVVLQVGDGSCVANLQVVIESSLTPPCQLLHTGTCIIVEGLLQKSWVLQGKYVIELKVDKLHHIGTVEYSNYPLSKKRVPLDKLREFCHIRPRTTTVQSVMRIRNALEFAAHTFCQNHGFLSVHVPIITTTDGKGSSEKFHVTSHFAAAGEKEEPKKAVVDNVKSSEGYFSSPTYLTSSGKMHLESYACALGNVYSFGPRFRAEKGESPKHAAEMWMIEVELAFSELEEAINCAGDFFKSLCKWVVENCSEDMKFLSQRIDKTRTERLQSMVLSTFERVSYTEALDALKKVTEKKKDTMIEWGAALTEADLRYAYEHCEKGESPKHAAEMWMIEVELAFSELEEAINCAGDFFKSLCKWVVENCSEDMKFLSQRIDKTRTERLQSMVLSTFERVSYTEALDALKKVTEKKKDTMIEWGAALTEADLRYAYEHCEKGESPKHAAEMWMIEVELAFSELEEAINCAGDFFKSLCKWVVENCSEDMKFLSQRIDKTRTERLQSMVLSTFERVSYTEALDALKKVTEKKKDTMIEWGAALTEADLSYLADEIYKKPVIVYNYPKETKPFYVRLNDDGKTVAAFDMVVPKAGRLISGSQNEERINILTTRIKELGLAAQQYEWYLDLRRHGTVKHSGFNLEFDHMVLFATGLNDVRDVIPFPRSRGKANY